MTTQLSLLAEGRQQFISANGGPLVGGTVATYIPSTLTPKATYSDAGGLSQNPNPLTLDALGSAAIWGSGYYRMIVKDIAGNTIYDQVGLAPSIITGGIILDTVAALQAANIDNTVNSIDVSGYYTAGDGGAALYARASAGSGPGKVQSADGAWWQVSANQPNVKQFGAKSDGATDATAAFQSAANYANSIQFAGQLFVPPGTYLITSTVQLGELSLLGVGRGSIIKPSISDGTPVFNFVTGTNYFSVQGVTVDSGLNGPNFETGAINAQNCTAIRVQSGGGTFSARFYMSDVLSRGCKVGYDITGFITTLKNVWATYCETGFIGSTMNSSRLELRFESCRKDLSLSNSNGVHIDQMLTEGAVLQTSLVSSTIDGCNGLAIEALYLEQVRNVPFIIFGGTTLCTGVSIEAVYGSIADNALANYDTTALAFDQVNGLDISGFFSTGQRHNRYTTTTNTKNIRDNTDSSSPTWAPHDNSKNLGPARNLFPNPNFDMWFRGWPQVDIVRQTPAQETTIVRRGNNALRMTMIAGQPNGYTGWIFNDNYLGFQLAGKTVTAYAWIWIPNTADFSPQLGNLRPTEVDLGIFHDGTGSGTTRSDPTSYMRGQWNLFRVTATLPSDCTRIDIYARILALNGVATGTEYIVVDSVFLIEGDGGQDQHITNGWIADSDLLQTRGLGDCMITRAASAPFDPNQTYFQGDEARKWTVNAGDSPGWICTTGGVGGVAVWKAEATIAV